MIFFWEGALAAVMRLAAVMSLGRRLGDLHFFPGLNHHVPTSRCPVASLTAQYINS